MEGSLIVKLKDENIVLPAAYTLGAEGGPVGMYILIIHNVIIHVHSSVFLVLLTIEIYSSEGNKLFQIKKGK